MRESKAQTSEVCLQHSLIDLAMMYTVSQAGLEADRDPILNLWRNNLPKASAGRYEWLYGSKSAAAWILRHAEDGIVGAAGLMHRRLRIFGQNRLAGQAVDLNVDPNHRTMGPALKLQHAVAGTVTRGGIDLIYAFSNAKSQVVEHRAGYRVLASIDRWVLPLRFGPALNARLENRWVRAIAPTVINPLLRLRSGALPCRLSGARVEWTDAFDSRFDDLWESASRRFPVLGERTSDYLTWRFAQCPGIDHQVTCLLDKDDRLLAYLVHYRRNGMVYIGDFFFRQPAHLNQLFAAFLAQMRRETVEAIVIVFVGAEAMRRQFRKWGFWKAPRKHKALLYLDTQRFDFDCSRLFDTENWYLTLADFDTES
jgi:hypothetical protein